MSRDTLLIVTTSFPQAGDGSEAAGGFVADIAQALATHLPVQVVAPGAKAGNDILSGGVPVRRFASTGRPLSLLSPKHPSDWWAIASTLQSLRQQTLAADEEGRIAHTLALWALPSGWAARELQRRKGVPYSVWALGSDIWSLGRIPVVRQMLARVLRSASHGFADGVALARDAAEIGGIPIEFLPSVRKRSGIRVLPVRDEPPFSMLYLGRWHPNKGTDLLLDALDLLGDESWASIRDVHIAGGGPMEALVHERVRQLCDAGRPVRISGFLGEDAAELALGQADMLLLPSRVESIPLVFADALKFGLTVVSTPVGDLPSLVPEAGGCLASAVSPAAFASAMETGLLERSGDSIASIARAARMFSLDEVSTRLSSLLVPVDGTA